MRPQRLRLKGFRSWADEATISFDGRGLVGIVGPNGAGKSSLFDAVTYALYGRTVTAGARTRRLINQNLDVASVDLTFACEGRAWRVVRTMRRRGGTDVGLYTAPTADGPWEAAAGVDPLARTVTRRVEDLVGVDFDGFQRSVLLAQGQFDLFLSAAPAERDQILKRVFGYDRVVARIRAAARAAADEHGTEAARLQTEAVRLGARIDSDADIGRRLNEARSRHQHFAERGRRLARIAAPWETVSRRLSDTDRAVRQWAADAARIRQLADTTAGLHQWAADVSRVEDAVSRLGAARGVYRAATERADRAVADLETVDPEPLEATGRAVADLERVDRELAAAAEETADARAREAASRQARDCAAVEAEEAAAAASSAAAAANTADLRVSRLRARVRAAQDTEAAAARIRAALADGSQCPVCYNPVGTAPAEPHHPDSDSDGDSARLAALETEYDRLRRRQHTTERAAADTRGRLAAARADTDTHRRAARRAAAREQSLADRRAATVGTLTRMWGNNWRDAWQTRKAEHSRHRDERDRALAAERAARTALSRREAAHQQTVADADRAARTLRTAAERAGFRWEPPTHPGRMTEAAEQFTDRHRRALAATDRRCRAARRRSRAARRLLDVWREQVGIGPGVDLAHETVRVATETAHWQQTVRGHEQAAADLEEARRQLTAVETLHENRQSALHDARQVARDMTDSRFVKYLLDEHRARLIDAASRWLTELTDGRYQFADDNGTISVADQSNAGNVRAASGLSGGEKFLSSLALAMALTETVTADGSRLGAFFLDEGFGTLDPEHLDLAMRGVETVAARTGTLALVVSHVPDMRARIDDLIVLERGPSGSTVLTEGADGHSPSSR